jgi:hypothetical protein
MKIATNRITLVFAALVVLAINVRADQQGSASWVWEFNLDANPASSKPPSTPTAEAAVVEGQFASGWLDTNSILGNVQGVWDLGRNGTITVTSSSPLIDGSAQTTLSVRINQYRDGEVYSALTHVSVARADLLAVTTSVSGHANLGDWVTQETLWQVPVGTAIDSIVITSALNGSLIDRIAVQTPANLATGPQLSIQKIGSNQVKLSWPSSYSTMLLESAGDLNQPVSWEPVSATLQVSGDTASVVLDAADSSRWYRLHQP